VGVSRWACGASLLLMPVLTCGVNALLGPLANRCQLCGTLLCSLCARGLLNLPVGVVPRMHVRCGVHGFNHSCGSKALGAVGGGLLRAWLCCGVLCMQLALVCRAHTCMLRSLVLLLCVPHSLCWQGLIAACFTLEHRPVPAC
jgi:hypothetical protein